MSNILEEYYNTVVRERDDMTFKAFEEFGYSRAKVYRMAHEGRIKVVVDRNCDRQISHFEVDGTRLFSVTETIDRKTSLVKIERSNW